MKPLLASARRARDAKSLRAFADALGVHLHSLEADEAAAVGAALSETNDTALAIQVVRGLLAGHRRAMEARAAETGPLKQTWKDLLALLAEFQFGTPKALAARLSADRGHVGESLQDMAQAGLVYLMEPVDGADGRLRPYALTTAGRRRGDALLRQKSVRRTVAATAPTASTPKAVQRPRTSPVPIEARHSSVGTKQEV